MIKREIGGREVLNVKEMDRNLEKFHRLEHTSMKPTDIPTAKTRMCLDRQEIQNRLQQREAMPAEQISHKLESAQPDILSDKKLNLNAQEQNWVKKALEKKDMIFKDGKEYMKDISFTGSATCITGKTGCTGCAGPLLDKKYGCQTGACTGGTKIP